MPTVVSPVNVSEGRRPDVIAACGRAAGAALLRTDSDAAHHRSVFTLGGTPDAVVAAVERLAAAAIALIDLRVHRGVHPRIGAIDVVPFVPVRAIGLDGCVSLARRVGQAIAEAHAVPVLLYEAAATAPHRRRLEDIRRGQFEGLAARLSHPSWRPDFGPTTPHPTAGATAVGARGPLVAFNVNLNSRNLAAARQIARIVRERNGGLPGIKALGLLLADRDIVQVSMNLTTPETTSVVAAYDAVAQEAGRRGIDVLESELIGLAPASVLSAAIAAHVRLRDFSPSRILEEALAGTD